MADCSDFKNASQDVYEQATQYMLNTEGILNNWHNAPFSAVTAAVEAAIQDNCGPADYNTKSAPNDYGASITLNPRVYTEAAQTLANKGY